MEMEKIGETSPRGTGKSRAERTGLPIHAKSF